MLLLLCSTASNIYKLKIPLIWIILISYIFLATLKIFYTYVPLHLLYLVMLLNIMFVYIIIINRVLFRRVSWYLLIRLCYFCSNVISCQKSTYIASVVLSRRACNEFDLCSYVCNLSVPSWIDESEYTFS